MFSTLEISCRKNGGRDYGDRVRFNFVINASAARVVELKQFLEEKRRSAIVSEASRWVASHRVGDTGCFRPNPRLGRVFVNESILEDFWLEPEPGPSFDYEPLSLSLHSFRRVLSTTDECHTHLHTVHFQYLIFADSRVDESARPGSAHYPPHPPPVAIVHRFLVRLIRGQRTGEANNNSETTGDDETQSRRSFYPLSGGLKNHRLSGKRLLSISFICIYADWRGGSRLILSETDKRIGIVSVVISDCSSFS